MLLCENFLLVISLRYLIFYHVTFIDINKGKTDLAYNRRLTNRRNLLRHRQWGFGGHEQRRMCLFHGDVSYVHRHDAYDINM